MFLFCRMHASSLLQQEQYVGVAGLMKYRKAIQHRFDDIEIEVLAVPLLLRAWF